MQRFALQLVVMVGVLVFVSQARANTVGLWLMDDYFDATPSPNPGTDPDPDGGETIPDSSGNSLDFVATTNFGSVSQDTDRPSVITTGTSLRSLVGGGGGYVTPSTSLLHRGTTGELTIEFWFKSLRITPSFAYIVNFPGGNGGSFPGDWGVYSNSSGDLRFFEYSNGFPEVGSGAGASDGDWHHVAFTIDSAGVMTSYLDGGLITQSAATGASAAALADALQFAHANNSFADHDFLIDELRISDVALLPGTGTGNGELAWNASLVPEPTSVLLLVSGGLMLLRRRG